MEMKVIKVMDWIRIGDKCVVEDGPKRKDCACVISGDALKRSE